MSISFPGGLTVMRGKETVVPRTSDPREVLKLLGISAEPSEVSTFEDLVDTMLQDPRLKKYLGSFDDYIAPYLKRDPENAQKAVSYIQQVTGVRENLRRLIRGILTS